MNESVQQITTAIASGDTEAFARFYRRWFDFVYAEAARTAGHRGRDEQFCMDIVQEAMMRVIRFIKPMQSEVNLNNWLRAVVQSCCYDQLRIQLRRQQREQKHALKPQEHSHDEDMHERLEWLRQRLASLDPELVDVLSMRYRLGWTLQRIGRALGLKPGAVDGRINRSIVALRKHAKEEFHDS